MSDASPRPYRVLLSDLDGSDISAEIPYLFAKAGCTVEAFCTADSWLIKGSYTTVWHKTEAKDPESYAKGLVDLLSTHSFDWIVLTNDYALRAINDYITDDELALRILPISNAKNRPLVGSKAALSTLSALHHIPTPPFVVYTSDTDIEQAVDTVGLPLLLKIDRSGGGRGLFFCTNKQMVYDAINTLTEKELHNLVLQKYIVGTNVAVEALYREGKLIAYSHATIHKNAIDEFGVSISRIYSPAPEIKALLSEIGESFSFDGFCSYTFMREKSTGTHFLVEADLRTHAWFVLSQNAGVDFSEGIRTYLQP
ncbi:MAG: ATP-grasp domain-containing protein, partial [Candidatus Pacebacteria bacterium]|nr:ATP-grasp domain-containing protein [Candidatus Paceibacterota bacterium]